MMQVMELLDAVDQIKKAHDAAKILYADRLAPDYNVFDFIEPNEMRLSKILAWLLKPQGSHGQGSHFLRLFLDALGEDSSAEAWDDAQVFTEFPITDGRLDILVRTTKFQLAIENKPWAGDQDNQIERYFAHFNRQVHSNYRVVYLTPNGTAPISISEPERKRRIEAGQLLLLSYEKEVLASLGKCRAECRADRVLTFIDEFSRYIQAVFLGVRDRTMTDHLVDQIANSRDAVSCAMQVIVMADTIRRRLLSDLGEQLRKQLPNHSVDITDDTWKRWGGYVISYSEQSPYQFGLGFEQSQFNCLIVGVRRKIKNSLARGNEYESLDNSFGTASPPSEQWLWWRRVSPNDLLLPVARDWEKFTTPWVEIADKTLAKKIACAFKRTHEVLTACGVG